MVTETLHRCGSRRCSKRKIPCQVPSCIFSSTIGILRRFDVSAIVSVRAAGGADAGLVFGETFGTVLSCSNEHIKSGACASRGKLHRPHADISSLPRTRLWVIECDGNTFSAQDGRLPDDRSNDRKLYENSGCVFFYECTASFSLCCSS